jgi:hypothetical protein
MSRKIIIIGGFVIFLLVLAVLLLLVNCQCSKQESFTETDSKVTCDETKCKTCFTDHSGCITNCNNNLTTEQKKLQLDYINAAKTLESTQKSYVNAFNNVNNAKDKYLDGIKKCHTTCLDTKNTCGVTNNCMLFIDNNKKVLNKAPNKDKCNIMFNNGQLLSDYNPRLYGN